MKGFLAEIDLPTTGKIPKRSTQQELRKQIPYLSFWPDSNGWFLNE
jgi:hypothetical protein